MDSTTMAEPPLDDAPPSKEGPGKPRKVFISYQRKDRKFASRLAGDLREKGVTVWIDTVIQGGDTWLQKLHEGLQASEEVFLIASPRSKASAWVQKEVLAAMNRNMPVTPLVRRRYGSWTLIDDLHYVDFRGRYEEALVELMKQTPPTRTFWRKVLILLNKSWDFRPYFAVLAVGMAIAAFVYYSTPSKTSLHLTTGDAAAIHVQVRNEGGRPSTLVGSSFKLDFGSLPIETERLVPLKPAMAIRIPGRDGVPIQLRDDEYLTPKMRDERYRYSLDDIRPLLAGAKITVTAQVTESDGRSHPVSDEFSGARIAKFIEEAFPDVPQPKYR